MGIAIVGAGGHGRVSLECLELAMSPLGDVAFFDDRWEGIASIEGVPVLGPISSLAHDARFDEVFVAIGSNLIRQKLFHELVSAGKRILTIVHPHSMISPRAHLQKGVIAIPGTVVNRDAHVGKGVILNTLCSVGHDCMVEDFAQIAPGVNLGGASIIEEGVFLGIGTKVVPEARIGAWSIIGAGSVVLDDLPGGAFCYGVPARMIRKLRSDELPFDSGSSTTLKRT
jgi:sugar O-acyltransferase (sialic acid O-acetyltransferase NeuD family)